MFGDEKYDVKPLECILKQRLGDTELKCTVPDIVVTSYDIENREPYLFKTRTAREDENRNHPLRVVARATSAAPTFFEPLLLGKGEGRALIDGGVFASNPSMTALAETVSSGAKLNEILLCSIGVGMNNRKIPYDEAVDWGPIGWAEPVISAMLDGMSDSADRNAQELLSNSKYQQYFRFDIPLRKASRNADDATPDNIVRLWNRAQKIIEKQDAELCPLVKKLCSRASNQGSQS